MVVIDFIILLSYQKLTGAMCQFTTGSVGIDLSHTVPTLMSSLTHLVLETHYLLASLLYKTTVYKDFLCIGRKAALPMRGETD